MAKSWKENQWSRNGKRAFSFPPRQVSLSPPRSSSTTCLLCSSFMYTVTYLHETVVSSLLILCIEKVGRDPTLLNKANVLPTELHEKVSLRVWVTLTWGLGCHLPHKWSEIWRRHRNIVLSRAWFSGKYRQLFQSDYREWHTVSGGSWQLCIEFTSHSPLENSSDPFVRIV